MQAEIAPEEKVPALQAFMMTLMQMWQSWQPTNKLTTQLLEAKWNGFPHSRMNTKQLQLSWKSIYVKATLMYGSHIQEDQRAVSELINISVRMFNDKQAYTNLTNSEILLALRLNAENMLDRDKVLIYGQSMNPAFLIAIIDNYLIWSRNRLDKVLPQLKKMALWSDILPASYSNANENTLVDFGRQVFEITKQKEFIPTLVYDSLLKTEKLLITEEQKNIIRDKAIAELNRLFAIEGIWDRASGLERNILIERMSKKIAVSDFFGPGEAIQQLIHQAPQIKNVGEIQGSSPDRTTELILNPLTGKDNPKQKKIS